MSNRSDMMHEANIDHSRTQFGLMRDVALLDDLKMPAKTDARLANIVRRIGYREAMLLCATMPGERIRQADVVHCAKVEALIGRERLRRLFASDDTFRVPTAYSSVVRAKLETIASMVNRKTLDPVEAEKRYALTPAQIRLVIRQPIFGAAESSVLPHPDELPIPDGIVPDPTWPEQLREMADYIGPVAALRVVVAFGGQDIYIAADTRLSMFRGTLRPSELNAFHQMYGGSRFRIPVCRDVLRTARRAGIIASVRTGRITINDASRVLRTSRTYVSHLVNHTHEGVGVSPIDVPVPRIVRVLTAAATIAETQLQAAGTSAAAIDAVRAEILALAREGISDAFLSDTLSDPQPSSTHGDDHAGPDHD